MKKWFPPTIDTEEAGYATRVVDWSLVRAAGEKASPPVFSLFFLSLLLSIQSISLPPSDDKLLSFVVGASVCEIRQIHKVCVEVAESW